jgi:hypothetical protein
MIKPLVVALASLPLLGFGFSEPDPIDFHDHAGFVQIFDGTSFAGWDHDPAVWRLEDGAMVAVSTREKPIGHSYISYHGTPAKDFDLRLEIRCEGGAGSGIQYRSQVGLPWRGKMPGGGPPPNLNWMMTGPQADFWPGKVYSGQFYSENTGLGIIAWRGQVVRSEPGKKPRLVGTIGDRARLGAWVKDNDWNQYEVIARGPVMIHILNGQLMSVLVDDDPASSNNASGLIGIELEAVGRVMARDIWLRKID